MRLLLLVLTTGAALSLGEQGRIGCRKMSVDERCKNVRRCRRVMPKLKGKCVKLEKKRKKSREMYAGQPQFDPIPQLNEVENINSVQTTSYPAEIVVPPRNQTAPVGGTAEFTCVAAGAPTPQTSIVTRWASQLDEERAVDIETTESETLSEIKVINIIRLVTEADEGWYRCTTQNVYGGETAEAYLRVLDLCKGVVCANPKHACVGDYENLTHSCQCRDYCEEEGNIDFNPVCGTDCATYYSPCKMKQASCQLGYDISVLYNSRCPQFSDLQASIRGAPGPIVFFEDDTLQLECLVEGTPHPNVKWYKSQSSNSNTRNFVTGGSQMMVFQRALLDDTGYYTCVVENCVNQRLESNPVQVIVRPRFQALTEQFTGSMCHLFGDPHVQTFDGFTYTFSSACDYVLAMDCVRGTWLIYGKVVSCGNGSFCLQEVSFYTGREVLVLARGWVVSHGSRKIQLSEGREITASYFKLSFDGLYVTASLRGDGTRLIWDGISSAIVQIPKGQYTCGLCGDNDGNPDNEATGGIFAWQASPRSIAEFAWSWRVDTGSRCVFAAPRPACTENQLALARDRCEDVFSARALRRCTAYVNPDVYVSACVHDSCHGGYTLLRGDVPVACQVAAVYLKKCGMVSGQDVPRTLTEAGCPSTRFIQPAILSIGCPQNEVPFVS